MSDREEETALASVILDVSNDAEARAAARRILAAGYHRGPKVSDLEALTAERDAEREARKRLEAALREIADGDAYDDEGERIVIPLTASQAQAVASYALGGSA